MPSVGQFYSQIPANKLWTNIASLASSIVDSNNNLVPWAQGGVSPANNAVLIMLSTPGSALLRDMGRNIYLPDPTIPTSVGSQSSIYRRVQLVTNGSNTVVGIGSANTVGGYYGTGDSIQAGAGSDTDFLCGYIRLGGQTYGGGNGLPAPVARVN